MSSRAVFLPTPGDPFICLLSLHMFKNFIDEVDCVYVYLNGDIEESVVAFLKKKYESYPKVQFKYHRGMLQHGNTLAQLTTESPHDHVMFLEDDAYILKKGTVDQYFTFLETGQYDVIGSPRTSSSMDLQTIVSRKYNVDLSGAGDKGIGLWPNFLFAKRSDLLKTDLNFNAMEWKQGEYISQIDWTVQADNGVDIRADTFVWGAIQLRALGARILEVPQYHCHPYWNGDRTYKTNVFSPECFWLHSGSLSGSIYGILTGDDGNPLSCRSLGRTPLSLGWRLPPYCTTPSEKMEFQRRCAFYLIAHILFRKEAEEIVDFSDAYLKAVNRVINQYDLDRNDIGMQMQAYSQLLGVSI